MAVDVMCNPTYIENYTSTSTVKVVSPGSNGGKLLFIANSYEKSLPIVQKMGLEEVYTRSRYITTSDGCYKINSNGDIRIMTSGVVDITESDLTSGGSLPECKLESGVAKIVDKFEVPESIVNIASLQMKGVCSQLYYAYPASSKSGVYPDIENFESVDYESVKYDKDQDS